MGHQQNSAIFSADLALSQIEVLIAGLLMGFGRETCVAASLIYGLVMLPVVLFSTTMSVVFIGAAIVGGGIDMLIVSSFI